MLVISNLIVAKTRHMSGPSGELDQTHEETGMAGSVQAKSALNVEAKSSIEWVAVVPSPDIFPQ